MGTTYAGRRFAYALRVCLLSVSACLYLTGSARAEDTTGTLLYAGADTLKTKKAAGLVVDSTTTGGTVLTSGSLTVYPGNPWRFNGGTELEGIGGSWDASTTNILINQWPQSVTTTFPDPVPDPEAVLTVLGAANFQDDFGSYLITYPQSLLDVNVNDDHDTVSTNKSGRVIFRFSPTAGMRVFPGTSGEAIYGSSVTLGTGGIDAFGPIVSKDTPGPFSGSQVATIASIPGGLAAVYVGVGADLHVDEQGYFHRGTVFGLGAQFHGPTGATWWETAGSGTAPTSGYQETVAYTDRQGWRILNNFAGVNTGSVGNTFNFDDDILSSGTIETTSAAYIGGRVIANTAAPVTAGAQLQSPSLAVGAAVLGSASYATSGHAYLGTTSGSTQNILDCFTDSTAAVFDLINDSATASSIDFRGNTNGNFILGFRAAGTNRNTTLWGLSTGTGFADVLLSKPGSSGSSVNASNNLAIRRVSTGAAFDCTDSTADQAVVLSNSNGSFVANFALEGRVGVGTTTPPTSGAQLQTPSLSINGGTTLAGYLSNTATLDFGSISAGATAELTITVTGAATGDSVAGGPPSGLESGLMECMRVSAANTVTVRLHNTTGAGIDPASATWRVSVFKH